MPAGDQPSSDQSRFDLLADGYERPALRAFQAVAERLVELAEIQSGQIVVDACCGTGHATLAAAARVGRAGRVVGVDSSEAMCARARDKVQSRALAQVTIRQGNATSLAWIETGTIDVVISSSALYTLPEPRAALTTWRRVLRRGGRLAFSTLGTAWSSFYLDLLRRFGVQLPSSRPLEALDTEDKCAAMARDAGFRDVVAVREEFGYQLARVEDAWDIIWYTGARFPLTYLPDEVVAQIKQEYLTTLGRGATATGLRIEWPAILTLAQNPTS